jgi:signal transduction histidine kinase
VAAQAPDAAVTLNLAAHMPLLSVDRTRMKLLLRNLIDNALRHGAGAFDPPTVTSTFDAASATLTVRDFGPGVPRDQLPKLTEAFHRVDIARQRATGGVGLGLHLCLQVARAHGGQLEIHNAGPGLAVDVKLPRSLSGSMQHL